MIAILVLGLLLQTPTEPVYTVAGTLVNSVTKQPLNKARLHLSLTSNRFKPVTVTTDAGGKFSFSGVKAGSYNLAAERLGFIRQSYYEHPLYSRYSSAIIVGEGEDNSNLLFPLLPGAVIEGNVRDSKGEGIAGLKVYAMRMAGVGGHRHIQLTRGGSTDDRGYYRIAFCPSGDFIVLVTGRPHGSMAEEEATALAPAFFPGVSSLESAREVKVQAGQSARADLVLQRTPAATIQGTVKLSATGSLTLVLGIPGINGKEFAFGNPVDIRGNNFSVTDIPYGRYGINIWESRKIVAYKVVDVQSPDFKVDVGGVPLSSVSVKVQLKGDSADPTAASTNVTLQDSSARFSRALDKDGAVTFPSVPQGSYTVIVGSGRTFPLLASRVTGASMDGGILEVPESGSVEMELVADSAATDVPGKVFKENKPFAGALVMLFPRDQVSNTSTYRFDQSDSDGSFNWHGVAPGEYVMLALEEGENWDYINPAVVRSLMDQSLPITVGAKAPTVVQLYLARPVPKTDSNRP